MKKKILFPIVMTIALLLLFVQSASRTADAAGPEELKKYASRTVYTVQTGSFKHIEDAQNQFDSMVQGLSEKYLEYLRIEKIGKYHTVRTGIFEDKGSAATFLQAVKSRFPSAVIQKAYIKGNRIKKLYRGPSSVDKQKMEKKVVTASKPQKTAQRKYTKSIHQKEPVTYTIKTGRYVRYDEAEKEYESLVQGSSTRELAYSPYYLRIEKAGEQYSVRIGIFNDRVSAEGFRKAIISRFPRAVVIKDDIKEDRIIKLYTQ